jgi:hypothetical protein
MTPKMELTVAPIKEAPNVNLYEAMTRGAVTSWMNWPQVKVIVFKISAAIGISTIKLK